MTSIRRSNGRVYWRRITCASSRLAMSARAPIATNCCPHCGAPLPREGQDSEAVLDLLAAQAARGAIASGSPRYFGFVIGGTYPVALAADWLASTWDQNAGIYATSPLSSVIEEIAGRWLVDLFDLPRGIRSGLRHRLPDGELHMPCRRATRGVAPRGMGRRGGWPAGRTAYHRHRLGRIARHHRRRAALPGPGYARRARVDSDAQGRMRVDGLRALLDRKEGPTIVCAQAGNVNTGAFDPLREIGEVANAHGAWLHVDGAFGLWARASRRASRAGRRHRTGRLLGDRRAQVAERAVRLRRRDRPPPRGPSGGDDVGRRLPDPDRGPERDAVDWVPEFSRRARGVPVYATLRALGRDGVEDLVDRCCACAARMGEILTRRPACEHPQRRRAQPGAGAFRRRRCDHARGRYRRAGRRHLLAQRHDVARQAAMRVSVSNWSTTADDIDTSADAIVRVYRALQPR